MRLPPPGRSFFFCRPDTPTLADRTAEVRPVSGLDLAALRDAVLARRIARQPPHALLQRERAGLAHPVREEMQPVAGVAEVDEVRAGIGQRDSRPPDA